MNVGKVYRNFRQSIQEAILLWGAILLLALTPAVYAHPQNAEEDAALSREILGEAPALMPMVLDMSNDKHYRFFKNRLVAAGLTEESSRMFERLEGMREKHRREGVPDPGRVVLDLNSPEQPNVDELGPVQIISSFDFQEDGEYAGVALSSIPNEPEWSFLSIELKSPDGTTLNTGYSEEEAYQGSRQFASVRGILPSGLDELTVVSSFAWKDEKGEHAGHVYATTAPADVLGVSVEDPKDRKGPQNKPDGKIKMCLGRSGSDCDYEILGAGASNIYFPVNGYAIYKDQIQQPFTEGNSSSSLTITNPNGGGCYLTSTTKFFDHVDVTGRVLPKLTWTIPKVEFLEQNAWGCLAVNARNYYNQSIQVTTTSDKFPNGKPVLLTIADYDAPPPNAEDSYRLYKIPPFYVYYSCLAEGTEVLLADGSRAPIETIRQGDRLRTDDVDDVMTVRVTYEGIEKTPLVRLVTDAGHSLLLTDGHTVVTPGGVELAKHLRVGDRVNTADGVSILTSVSREAFAGKVHNLAVGQDGDALARTADNTTFFANGIQVGDSEMQFTYAHQERRHPQKLAAGSGDPEQKQIREAAAKR